MRRIQLLLLSSLGVLLLQCQSPEAPKVMAVGSFIDVLTEVRILEGSYAAIVTKPDTIKPYMSAQYDAVFRKFGVDHQTYYQAYEYYLSQPQLMEGIEDSVINRIGDRLNALQIQDTLVRQ
jgi:hypothetical protein